MILRCATTNSGKVREFNLAAESLGFPEIRIELLPGLRTIEAPEEKGSTFEENAVLKAVHYSRFSDLPTFADDSGLEVDALDNAPGVYSARYAGPGATDLDNNHLLIANLREISQRTARFVCVIALAQAGSLLGTFRGVVSGTIVDQPKGSNGFGYDPHFFYEPFGCTFGEASHESKMGVSHRGQALRELLSACRTGIARLNTRQSSSRP